MNNTDLIKSTWPKCWEQGLVSVKSCAARHKKDHAEVLAYQREWRRRWRAKHKADETNQE